MYELSKSVHETHIIQLECWRHESAFQSAHVAQRRIGYKIKCLGQRHKAAYLRPCHTVQKLF